MKTRFRLILAVALLPFTPADAQVMTPLPQINVSGSAEVKVVPDEVQLYVGAESRDTNLAGAKHQNDENIAKALQFLKEQGLADKDIQTDFLCVQPVYHERSPAIDYYTVQKNITVRLTTVTNFEAVLTGLLSSGVNHVLGVRFCTTQLRKYRDQARAMAVKAATEKAGAMASETHVKLGKVYNIGVNDWGGWINYGGYGGANGMYQYQNGVQNVAGDAPAEETFAVGQISVDASVNVTFLID
jgi:uncharacterized protein YggE